MKKNNLFRYDKITLFFINLILLILFLTDSIMRSDILYLIFHYDSGLIIISIVLGFLFTIYHSFFEVKNNFGKAIMGGYIILINLYIGVVGISYLIVNSQLNYYIIFPLINILISIIILVAMRVELISAVDLISDKQVKRKELVVGIIFIPLLIFISQYLLKNHWVITFSMCLFYITVINSFLLKLYSKK